jgi:hypothetical protein
MVTRLPGGEPSDMQLVLPDLWGEIGGSRARQPMSRTVRLIAGNIDHGGGGGPTRPRRSLAAPESPRPRAVEGKPMTGVFRHGVTSPTPALCDSSESTSATKRSLGIELGQVTYAKGGALRRFNTLSILVFRTHSTSPRSS